MMWGVTFANSISWTALIPKMKLQSWSQLMIPCSRYIKIYLRVFSVIDIGEILYNSETK